MYFLQVSHEVLFEEVLDAVDQGGRGALLKAFGLASRAHEDRREGGGSRGEGAPPVDHPVRVMYSLYKEQGVRDVDMLVTALLHDVLEVSDVTRDEIEREFGPKVAGWVDLLTRKEGVSRKEYALKIKEAPYEVFLIEMAARLDNLRTAHRRKESLQPYFNETRDHFLLAAERRSKEHPALRIYTDAMRMLLEGD